MPRIRALTATVENMERCKDVPGVFAYDRSTGDRFSATPGAYWHSDGSPERQDDGRPMILAREVCEIVPVIPS
jgi:hypothetical protein